MEETSSKTKPFDLLSPKLYSPATCHATQGIELVHSLFAPISNGNKFGNESTIELASLCFQPLWRVIHGLESSYLRYERPRDRCET